MAQSRHKSRVVTRAVLKGLVAAGALTSVVVAPNSAKLTDIYFKRQNKKNTRRTLTYLKYQKLIEVKVVDGEQHYRLTNRGRDKYQRILLDELKIDIPRRWDHKWRMVVFDIPAKKINTRRRFLNKLNDMDFFMLQRSIWIHPFECEKQIGVLVSALKLENHVSFFVVEKGNFVSHATAHFKQKGLLI